MTLHVNQVRIDHNRFDTHEHCLENDHPSAVRLEAKAEIGPIRMLDLYYTPPFLFLLISSYQGSSYFSFIFFVRAIRFFEAKFK